MSKESREFIAKEIKHEKAKGKSQKQAEAIALNVARKKGYKVATLPSHIRRKERMR